MLGVVFGGLLLDWIAGGYRQRKRTLVAMSVISIPSLLLLPWTMYPRIPTIRCFWTEAYGLAKARGAVSQTVAEVVSKTAVFA